MLQVHRRLSRTWPCTPTYDGPVHPWCVHLPCCSPILLHKTHPVTLQCPGSGGSLGAFSVGALSSAFAVPLTSEYDSIFGFLSITRFLLGLGVGVCAPTLPKPTMIAPALCLMRQPQPLITAHYNEYCRRRRSLPAVSYHRCRVVRM